MDTPSLMQSMSDLVSEGAFAAAVDLGKTGDPPLSVSLSEMAPAAGEVARGPNSVVTMGTFRNRSVAIKKPRLPTSTELERFKKELRLMARCSHPSVLPVVAAKLLPPDYLLVTPLCASNLQREVHVKGWRPAAHEWTRLAEQLSDALAYLHDVAAVIHRDVKPANVLLAGDAENPRHPFLADFGLAEDIKEYEEDKARTMNGFEEAVAWKGPRGGFKRRFQVGTLEYLSPESLMEHTQSPASDVYALAIMLCECVAGVYPFSDCTTENAQCHTILEMGYGQAELQKAVHGEGLRPIVPESVAADHRAILERMWAHDAGQRPTAKECAATWGASRAALGTPAAAAPEPEADTPMATAETAADAPVFDADGTRIGAPAAAASEAAAPAGARHAAWPAAPAWLAAARAPSRHFSSGAHATCGRRGADRMEDRHVLAPCLCTGTGDGHLVGVFDGHRGAEVADYAARHLVRVAESLWRGGAGPAGKAPPASTEAFLKDVFVSLDAGFAAEEAQAWQARLEEVGGDVKLAGKRAYPGCTAIAAFVYGGELFVANAGDCRGVLCRRIRPAGGSGETVYASLAVSNDHTPDNDAERSRVEAGGGKVRWLYDSYRIGEVGMQVTRSLGDLDLRGDGLTPEPEVLRVPIACEADGPRPDGALEEDLFVVLASDGLFDVLKNEEVVMLVNDTVKQPGMAATRLVTEAMTRGSGDNVTAAVLFLSPEMATEETIFAGGRQKYEVAGTFFGSRATGGLKAKLCHHNRDDTRWAFNELAETD